MRKRRINLIIPVLFGMLLTGCPTDSNTTTYLDFENVTFNSASYVYDGKTHILNEVSGVPEGTKVTYTGRESKINVGEYPATALLSKSGYNDKTLSATLSITPATFTNIKFNNKTVTYTGNEFSITCSNVPSFATVTYQNNKGTNAGTYNAIATISAPNYNDLTLRATLTINKATISGVYFNDTSYVYDGLEHSVVISGNLPNGVTATYDNNKRTNAGRQEASVTLSGPNFNTKVLYADLTIEKAAFTGISFSDLTLNYDGQLHTLTASGVPSFATVTYENNCGKEYGTYNATATISADNYETLELHATLTINAKTITSITFNDGNFDYDGEEHTILISGTLPEGVTATYSDNKRTDVGVSYASVTLSGGGYETLTLYAFLRIYDPNDLSDTLDCSPSLNKFLHTDEFTSGTTTLTTRRGLDIEFAYSNASGGDDSNWLVLNTGGCIYNVTPIDSFTDLSVEFTNGYEEFRVYYSYDEPVFDASRSKDYTASYQGYRSTDTLEQNLPVYFMIENIDSEPICFNNISVELDKSIINPTLTVTSNDTNYGTVSSGGKTKAGGNVTVKATAKSSYVFDSWIIDGKIVSLNAEYTFEMPTHNLTIEGKFITKTQYDWNIAHGARPTIDKTNKTVIYGMYPKTHVARQSLINVLNGISEPEENGWYLYNDEYYAKVVATPNTFNSGYIPEFDDGVEIYAGETYWFKVEPILWKYCKDDAFKKCGYLISEYLLDAQMFYSSKQSRVIDKKTVYPNNYEYSDIRTWLNGDFAAKAFSLGDYNLVEAKTDNGKSSTNNAKGSYYCNDCLDRVFLPSYKELTDFTYGFSGSNDEDRRAFTTDYSRAVGASFMNGDDAENGYVKFSAGYWTRSPDNSSFGQIYTVTTVQTTGYIAGYLANDYVDDVNVAVRPVINFREY